jgi:hypothetical protein
MKQDKLQEKKIHHQLMQLLKVHVKAGKEVLKKKSK